MRRRPNRFAPLAIYGVFTLLAPGPAAAATVASAGDASISRDQSAGTWTLKAGGTTMVLTLDAGRDLTISRLVTASGVSWTPVATSDSLVKVGSQTVAIGSRASGFGLADVTVEEHEGRLQLNATFNFESAGLRITRHYAIADGSPSFEVWNTYTPAGETEPLTEVSAMRIVVPNGTVRSLTGLRGDTADVESAGVFTLQQRALANGARLAISGKARSSESAVPWLAIDGTRDEFYLALMWSGAWSITADRSSAGIQISSGLATMTTTVREPIDGPHVVFGVVPGKLTQATAALRTYIVNGIRAGRPLTPLVTYNTWFAYGTTIDERSMLTEMDAAAGLGVELFVIDAGWYAGAGAAGPNDFDAGLGSWRPDPARFPQGLTPLRDHAHELGMKFGLWVEPERVSLALLGEAGVAEDWLVKTDGEYGSDHAAQICLSVPEARQFILDWLTPLLDDVQPDYLKWDNNMWMNCNREGHDHGASDGNFAQVAGLYRVLADIRERYPDMLIENVSGGGNRLDLGMLRYTDVAWMDDRTAPSIHVRHNVEGLSAVFPPAYLLSFVTDHESEPLHDGPDLLLYLRSRMAGVLGLCFRIADFSEGEMNVLEHEVEIYKGLRTTLTSASATLLTAQATDQDGGPAWDAMQATAAGGQTSLILAYQRDGGVGQVNVKPVALGAATTYSVSSIDSGLLGEATGAALMSTGIDIVQSPNTAAHILILTAKQ
jgi:alpha-galactosidase